MKKFDITVLLDRSGSMQDGKDDFIGGLRSFITDQKGTDPTDFTLIQFDSQNAFELVFDAVDVNTVDINKVDLIPRGGTPLLDAVGKTIAHIESRVKGKTDVQPLLMIITDGQNNASHEWDKAAVKKAVEDKTDWKIMFLGADMDAFAEADGLGISAGATMKVSKTASGIYSNFRAMNNSVTRMKNVYTAGGETCDALMAANYTDDERTACMDNSTVVDISNTTSTNI